ncbi:MAG: hypothetical protein AAFV53_01060, partial [Myxococcota bacterium]
PAGAVIPTLTNVPDTLAPATAEGVTDLEDADEARTIFVFGGDGRFIEADGTRYIAEGTASRADSVTQTLADGVIAVGGLSFDISGDTERTYTVIVYP